MNILNNYKKFLEKVQADFFQKNPDFYLKNKVKGSHPGLSKCSIDTFSFAIRSRIPTHI